MELSRQNLVNIARLYGIEPGHMGKKKLRKAILEKMQQMEEKARREARKPEPELAKRLRGDKILARTARWEV